MREKEKAAPTAPTVESGKDEQTILTGFKLTKDFIMEFEPAQGSIASFLNRGRENALTCRQLSRIAGLSKRKITMKICKERREGAPIMSSGSGFWLAEDSAEVLRCVKALHARAAQIHKTANAMEKRYG